MKDQAPPETRGVIEADGLRIPKHPDITVGGRRRALRTGTYELKETTAVKRIVRRSDVVLELGGGIGYMSTVLTKLCGAKHVHTFEANPSLLSYMADFHRENGVQDRITVHNALLAARKGKSRTFYIRKNFLGSSLDPDTGSYVDTADVDVLGLNATLRKIKPTILVCDIEGAEAELFPAGDFSGLRAAIIELHPQWIGQSGVQGVFDAMHRAGLTYFHRGSEGKVVVFRRDF
ncbi:MAG: FkbM family methyltransferase [Marinovum sp.]|nr:FkbM family methyltransferase [Marinovum sp.]